MKSDISGGWQSINWKDPSTWHPHGKCQHADPDIFFETDSQSEAIALGICDSCPVMLQCRMWAIEKREKFGTWGGLTEGQRRRVNTRRTRSRCPGCKSENVQELINRHESCLSCGLSWPV